MNLALEAIRHALECANIDGAESALAVLNTEGRAALVAARYPLPPTSTAPADRLIAGRLVTYETSRGVTVSGIIRLMHADATATVEARFFLDHKGERTGCYLGHRFRIPLSKLSPI
jgi:hypothetical protein